MLAETLAVFTIAPLTLIAGFGFVFGAAAAARAGSPLARPDAGG